MKPSVPILRKQEYYVQEANKADTRDFIRHHHYSKGLSNTGVYYHGLFRRVDDCMVGAAHWLPPTKNACLSVNRHNRQKVLALSRLAIMPGIPQNAFSFLLGRSVRLIKQERRFHSLVTYADDWQGHTGRAYLSRGRQYRGITSRSPKWVDPTTGRQVSRLSTKTRTNGTMKELGYEMIGVFAKHKFVLHIEDYGL